MGIYIKNADMPKSCVRYEDAFIITECEFMRDDWSCIFQTDCKPFPNEEEFKEQYNNCPLIEIAEPTETLIYDIKKLIAFIDPHMIIASTYAEQIERAEAVKDWLLSIVGESNATQHTQSVESVESALKGE